MFVGLFLQILLHGEPQRRAVSRLELVGQLFFLALGGIVGVLAGPELIDLYESAFLG